MARAKAAIRPEKFAFAMGFGLVDHLTSEFSLRGNAGHFLHSVIDGIAVDSL
jgi:hypothetical protein